MEKKSQNKITKKESTTEKPATLYRNPFLNFLQEFRKKNVGMPAKQIVEKAAEAWRNMGDNEKAPYYEMAKRAPKRKRGRKHRGRKASRKARTHSRHRSLSRSSHY